MRRAIAAAAIAATFLLGHHLGSPTVVHVRPHITLQAEIPLDAPVAPGGRPQGAE